MVSSISAKQGYYSVIRWRVDPTRDEARNVAVVLVDKAGAFGGVKAAPLSSISANLREQGLLDALLWGLEKQFESEVKPGLKELADLHTSLDRSLYLTEPKTVAVPEPAAALNALYRAYVAPRGGGGGMPTKGVVLDSIVKGLRKLNLEVRRGEYVGGFLFDAIVDRPNSTAAAVDVLSFATTARDWSGVEHDAGHFLYALEKTSLPGLGVIKPPAEYSHENAFKSCERVTAWFKKADVPLSDTAEPAAVAEALVAV